MGRPEAGAPQSPRFFVDPVGDASRVTLPGDEGRHARRVLRLGAGARITLFDGSGTEYAGRILEGVGREVEVAIEGAEVVDREAPVAVTLAVSVPKGRRLEDLLRAAAELGAARLVPLFTERSVVRERPDRGARADRLRRVSIEASKQCGRNRLTEIADPIGFDGLLGLGAEHDLALLATTAPGTVPLTEALRTPLRRGKILLTIGPEGGFSPGEIDAATAAGFSAVTLGRSRLRVATAAVGGVAMVLALAGSLRDTDSVI